MMDRLKRLALGAIAFACVLLPGHAAKSAGEIVYDISFAGYTGGPVLQWLAQKGFVPKRDADSQRSVVFSIVDKSLVLETKRRAAGLLLNEKDVLGYSRIKIEWGVEAFPAGASYLNGVRSESVMVIVFFGNQKLPSGSLLIPDSPYFIGLFLCNSDPIDHAFDGRYFKAGGRYVCVDHVAAGQTVVSDYPIADAFRRMFAKTEVPPVSGIGISIDTESTKGNGIAKGFVREIEFVR
jgi:hypothetical protein